MERTKQVGDQGIAQWTEGHHSCGCRLRSDGKSIWCSGVKCFFFLKLKEEVSVKATQSWGECYCGCEQQIKPGAEFRIEDGDFYLKDHKKGAKKEALKRPR